MQNEIDIRTVSHESYVDNTEAEVNIIYLGTIDPFINRNENQ